MDGLKLMAILLTQPPKQVCHCVWLTQLSLGGQHRIGQGHEGQEDSGAALVRGYRAQRWRGLEVERHGVPSSVGAAEYNSLMGIWLLPHLC